MTVRPITPEPPICSVVGDRLVVRGLEVDAADVVQGARRHAAATGFEDVSDFVVGALTVGAKALALANATVDVDELRRALGQLTSDVSAATQASVRDFRETVHLVADGENGTIVRAVAEALEALQSAVAELVTGEEAPVRAAIGKTVTDVTDRALGEVQRALSAQSQALRQILNSDDPASPLNALRMEVLRAVSEHAQGLGGQLQDVKTLLEVSAAVRGTLARSSAKGDLYEDDVFEVIERMTKAAGDRLERTGTVSGLRGRAKKGDGVITLSELVARTHDIRLAVEAKNHTQAMSLNAWKDELDASRKNRRAVAVLGIVPSPDQMPGHDRLRIIDPLTFIMAFDPAVDDEDLLVAAYQMLRAQAACVVLESDGDVDVAALRAELTKGLGLLTQVDKITKAAETAKTQTQNIVSTAATLRSDLSDCLQRSLRLLDGQS